MSDFSCPVVRIEWLRPIEGADHIELAGVLGYQVIVPCGQYAIGNLAVFVGEGAVLPRALAVSLRGAAKLFGEKKNRMRPYMLRGAMTDGILIGPLLAGQEGTDASRLLGIRKWEPVPEPYMRGECINVGRLVTPYDIQSWRRWPRVLIEGETVEMTEKIHGTFCGVHVAHNMNNPALPYGDTLIYSKGLGRLGFVFKDGTNLYVDTVKRFDIRRRMIHAAGASPLTIFGEIYGVGVQDLTYATSGAEFMLFDAYWGEPRRGRFLDRWELDAVAEQIGLPRSPILYQGPFEREKMRELASGATVLGKGANLREGVVLTPIKERSRPRPGRVIFKYVSPEYMTRLEGTEYQ